MTGKSDTPIDLIIVGAGMYVCGKGTEGYGTILPAAFEAYRQGLVKRVLIAATTQKSAQNALQKADELKNLFKISPEVKVYPATKEHDDKSFLAAIEEADKPCGAIVSVPDHLHCEITRTLIKEGIHVQVVKPLVATVAEVRELVELKNRYKVYGVVEFHKRFDEANLKLLEVIRQNALGELLNFRINFSQRKVIPTKMFRSWVDTTDVFQYLGVHYVDLIHFVTGAVPLRVMSIGTKKYLASQGIDNFDTIQTLIEWQLPEGDGHFLSSHLTGWIDPDTTSAMSDQRLEVIGTEGRYHSDQKNRGVMLVTDQSGIEEINPYFTQMYTAVDGGARMISGYGPQSIIQFVRDAADIIHNGRRPDEMGGLRATFESSLHVAAVLEASQKSLKNDNAWVRVEQ